MKKMIKYNWFFEQSPEIVWKYLTTSDLIAQWLMNNDFELVPGREFMFKSNPQPSMDFDGNVYCRILDIDPLKKLVYSWKIRQGSKKKIARFYGNLVFNTKKRRYRTDIGTHGPGRLE